MTVEAEHKGKHKADYGDVLIKQLAQDLYSQLRQGFYLAWSEILQTATAILGKAHMQKFVTPHFPLANLSCTSCLNLPVINS